MLNKVIIMLIYNLNNHLILLNNTYYYYFYYTYEMHIQISNIIMYEKKMLHAIID